MSTHYTPTIKWAQRKTALFLTVDIPDAKETEIALTKTTLKFSGKSEGRDYSFTLEFCKEVNPEDEGTRYTVRPRDIHFHIVKADAEDEEYWPFLCKDKAFRKRFVKTDWSRWVDDEDEEKEGFDTSHMGDGMGMGGMPGMGGMGGMPGMGGMGGMPGMGGAGGAPGGFDMSQLQAMMSQMGGDSAMPTPGDIAAAAPEADSDDSDDALPDLEPDPEEGSL